MPREHKTPREIAEYYMGDLLRWRQELEEEIDALFVTGTRDALESFTSFRNQLVRANRNWEHRYRLGKEFCWAFDFVPELSFQLRSGVFICSDEILRRTRECEPESWPQVVVDELKKFQGFVRGVIGDVDFPTLREHLRLEIEQIDEFDPSNDRTTWNELYRILVLWIGDPNARFAKIFAYAGFAMIASPWWLPYFEQLAVRSFGVSEVHSISTDVKIFWSGWGLVAISITLYVWIKLRSRK